MHVAVFFLGVGRRPADSQVDVAPIHGASSLWVDAVDTVDRVAKVSGLVVRVKLNIFSQKCFFLTYPLTRRLTRPLTRPLTRRLTPRLTRRLTRPLTRRLTLPLARFVTRPLTRPLTSRHWQCTKRECGSKELLRSL